MTKNECKSWKQDKMSKRVKCDRQLPIWTGHRIYCAAFSACFSIVELKIGTNICRMLRHTYIMAWTISLAGTSIALETCCTQCRRPCFKVVLVLLLFSIRQFSICHWMRLCDTRSTRISIWISNSWRFTVNNPWCNANNVLISGIPFEYKWCMSWQQLCASTICMHSSVYFKLKIIEHQQRTTSKGNPFTRLFHSCNFQRWNTNAIETTRRTPPRVERLQSMHSLYSGESAMFIATIVAGGLKSHFNYHVIWCTGLIFPSFVWPFHWGSRTV